MAQQKGQLYDYAARIGSFLLWLVLFYIAFHALAAGLISALSIGIEPVVEKYTWFIVDARLGREWWGSDKAVANIAWALAVHPAALLSGLGAAAATPRLGWWRVAFAMFFAYQLTYIGWYTALGAPGLEYGMDPPLDRLSSRTLAGAMMLRAISFWLALPVCLGGALLGCLLRPRPTDEEADQATDHH